MSEDPTQKLPPSSFEERVLAEFAAMRQEFGRLNERLDSLDTRLTSLDTRLTSLETRLTSLETRFTSLETRLTSLETRLIALDTRLTSLDTRLTSLEQRLTTLEEKVDARLRETRPIWEGILQRLTDIETTLGDFNRQVRALIADMYQVRIRVEKLEDSQTRA